MKLSEYLSAELDREAERSRLALEEIPAGQYDWKPHEKSMLLGYLANLVATIPTWVVMQINQPELDIAPATPTIAPKRLETNRDFVDALNRATADARAAFAATTDEHLETNWRLLARGQCVLEGQRYSMIQDTFSHWSHHRGQLTVYLRLIGARVPAIFGPSADENKFR